MENLEIIIYDDKYRLDLAELLQEMSKELYGTGMCDVDSFVRNHWVVYLDMINKKPVGLSSWSQNTYFGLRTPTVGNTYLFVVPEYRNSRASYILTASLFCKVSDETQLPIETYIASEHTNRVLHNRLEGKHLYDVYEYSPEQVKAGFNNLKYKKYT